MCGAPVSVANRRHGHAFLSQCHFSKHFVQWKFHNFHFPLEHAWKFFYWKLLQKSLADGGMNMLKIFCLLIACHTSIMKTNFHIHCWIFHLLMSPFIVYLRHSHSMGISITFFREINPFCRYSRSIRVSEIGRWEILKLFLFEKFKILLLILENILNFNKSHLVNKF